MSVISWFIAWVLDALIGDPQHWPHPVRWMGNMINTMQRQIRQHCHTPESLRWGGGLLWCMVVGITWLAAATLLRVASAIHPLLGGIVEVWMIFTTLAGRCLGDAAREVEQALRSGSLAQSRQKLSWIVGRDTSALESEQITRAVVETVAENTVDGVIAPLFFLMIGGAPLAMAYKAINTLDSMVGYKNAKYRDIGMVSAHMDDVANLIPARLSWILLSVAAGLSGLSMRRAFTIGWRDRYQHSSPNCAWSEATVAAALGVQLGGPNNYFGERVEKPWMGDARREIEIDDIPRAIRLMTLASLLALILFAACRMLVS